MATVGFREHRRSLVPGPGTYRDVCHPPTPALPLERFSNVREKEKKNYPGTSPSGSQQQNRCQSPGLTNSCSINKGPK